MHQSNAGPGRRQPETPIPEATMTPRTIYLSRLLGLFLLVLAASELT
jgi:hypothetical protein